MVEDGYAGYYGIGSGLTTGIDTRNSEVYYALLLDRVFWGSFWIFAYSVGVSLTCSQCMTLNA